MGLMEAVCGSRAELQQRSLLDLYRSGWSQRLRRSEALDCTEPEWKSFSEFLRLIDKKAEIGKKVKHQNATRPGMVRTIRRWCWVADMSHACFSLPL